MLTKPFRFVIVGGGTAGMIAASYLKKFYGANVEVFVIYDHKNPGIGVGESLTPLIYSYLSYLNITRDDMIRNVNATVKLGIKFKDWVKEGDEYIHSVSESHDLKSIRNFGPSIDIIEDKYDQDFSYGKYFFDNYKIPKTQYAPQSLHIDATLFSKYIENLFAGKITILDDIVLDVVKTDGDKIDHLVLEKNGKLFGDFYFDASGFKREIFKKLEVNWIDRSDWLPLDSCIPNPVFCEHEKIPPYTTSNSTKEGWILQVPLSNRWGCGYLFSSNFMSEEKAFDEFEGFIGKTFNQKLFNTSKVLKFKSGFWEKQWVGNCISIGLSSGFAEPLEATNIHHTIYQVETFLEMFNLKVFEHDIKNFNKKMIDFYDNIYLFLRFCYLTGRKDSDFWNYMTNNVPYEVKILEEKAKYDIINFTSFVDNSMFSETNFMRILYGLKKVDKLSYYKHLLRRNVIGYARKESEAFYNNKKIVELDSIDHTDYIKNILKKKGK